MNTGKETLSEDIVNQILNDEKLCNEILNEYSKDPKMQEKLNNHCCIPYPLPLNTIPFNETNCGINHHKAYDTSCKHYAEEHDMGATIPICTKYGKIGDFNCHKQCGY